MRRSSELLVRIQNTLSSISSAGEPLDELSRGILFQIAEAHGNKQKIRVSDITAQQKKSTSPTVYSRLKRLFELGLVKTEPCQEDGRSVLLTLTPESKKMIKELASSIRHAFGQ